MIFSRYFCLCAAINSVLFPGDLFILVDYSNRETKKRDKQND